MTLAELNVLLLLAGILLLLGIVSSKFSARFGTPVLVLFLGIGMLAGSDGIGGIAFEDYNLANALGSAALALILYDGGLRTSLVNIRSAWAPALMLSTLGVALTALFTGLAAAWVLDIPLAYGLLLGAIVGSTDAAAVFSILRTGGIKLPARLSATLEVESGSNDPMAIFLTLGLIGYLSGTSSSGLGMITLFVQQFGWGIAAGVGVGYVARWTVNRINLDHQGLYPILVMAFGLLTYGLAAVLNGSGFLAVYLAGIVLGNSKIVFRRGIFFFHDTMAWLGQIVLFVMLGLLVFPSRLIDVAPQGLVLALVLLVIARPIAVILSLATFRFNVRELGFLSWVGLKGAVPITLATFPLLAGIDHGAMLFDVVFFVVLVSALTQGWSLPTVARWLKVGLPPDPTPPLSLEIIALRDVDGEVVDYTVAPSARVAGQQLRNLALPDGVVVTLVVRNHTVIMPRGATALMPGDHVFMAMRTNLKPLIDRLFDPYADAPPLEPGLTLSFSKHVTIGQLHRFFDFPGPTWSDESLDTLLVGTPPGEPAQIGPYVVTPAEEEGYVMITYRPDQAQGSAA